MSEIENSPDVAALTVQLLSAYLSNNTVASEDLAGLILSTKDALTQKTADVPAEPAAASYTPAVSVRKSLASPDHILSMIDGKPYKVLKRHLSTHGLTPESYRERFNLAATYPMVAPTFAAHRRAIAEKIGLGSRKPTPMVPAVASATPLDEKSAEVATPKKRQPKAASPKSATVAANKTASTAKIDGTGGEPATAKAPVENASTAKKAGNRAKLGLFSNAGSKTPVGPQSNDGASSASAVPAAAKSGNGVAAVTKPARGKRMARQPKAAPSERNTK